MAVKRVGYVVGCLWKVSVLVNSRCSKWCPFAFTHAHNRLTNSLDVLWYAWPCVIDVLHQVADVADICIIKCTHIPASVAKFYSQPGFQVNWTVWWRDKIRCFLLKELDCFTSIEWCQNASCLSQLFNSKLSK